MNCKPLFLLLLTAAVIAPFDLQYKAFEDARVTNPIVTGATIDYGNFTFPEPSISISSYARSDKSKTLFAVAITNKNHIVDKNGLVVPSSMLVDCKEGSAQFNFNEKSAGINKQTMDRMEQEVIKFCQTHKQVWKHSDW